MKFNVLIGLVGLVLTVTGAHAHAQLRKAVPAVGGQVGTSPTAIRLTFSEGVEPRFSGIALATETGASVPTGKPSVDPSDASTLIVTVGKVLPAGTYEVTWRAVSVDTHKTKGSFKFSVTK